MRRTLPLLTLLLAACSGPDAAIAPPLAPVIPLASASLFERLGGRELLDALAVDLLAGITATPALAERLAQGDADERRLRLAEALCVTTGGPCSPRPLPPGAASPVPLAEAEETALEEALLHALDRFRIGEREKAELGPKLAQLLRVALGG